MNVSLKTPWHTPPVIAGDSRDFCSEDIMGKNPMTWLQNPALKEPNFMMHDDDINDLLCFYDSRRSQKVTHCCEILAELLEAFWGDSRLNHEIENSEAM